MTQPDKLTVEDLNHRVATAGNGIVILFKDDGNCKTIGVHELVIQLSDTIHENEQLREALNGLRGTVDPQGFSAWARNETPAIRAIEALRNKESVK